MSLCRVVFALVVSAGVLAVIGLGAQRVVTLPDPNPCNMTYMYPSYFRVPLPSSVPHSDRYTLISYREGKGSHLEVDRKPRGVPVLYLPGNSGSFRQVRSFASVAARRYSFGRPSATRIKDVPSLIDKQPVNGLDFFTVDFGEEFSGIHGSLLYAQAEYVAHAINHIVELYKDVKYKPESVIVVGHSMGGMVARGVVWQDAYTPGSVSTIVTMSTPHRAPPVSLNAAISKYYATTQRVWSEDGGVSSQINLVSLGGGFADSLVRGDLTTLTETEKVFSNNKSGVALFEGSLAKNTFSAVTTAVPGVWLTADHQCIVWCNQVVVAVVDTLMNLVDPTTRVPVADPRVRMELINERLRSHWDTATFMPSTPFGAAATKDHVYEGVPTPSLTQFVEGVEMHDVAAAAGIRGDGRDSEAFRFNITYSTNHFVLVTTLMPGENVFVALKKDADEYLYDLTQHFSLGVDNNVLFLPATSLTGYDAVVVEIEYVYNKDRGAAGILARFVKDKDVERLFDDGMLPGWFDTAHVSIPMHHAPLITLSTGVTSRNTPLSVRVSSSKCIAGHATVRPVLLASNPGSPLGETEFFRLNEGLGDDVAFTDLTVRFYASALADSPVLLSLIGDPHCEFEMSVTVDKHEVFAQFLRGYGPWLPGAVVAVALLALTHLHMSEGGPFSMPFSVAVASWLVSVRGFVTLVVVLPVFSLIATSADASVLAGHNLLWFSHHLVDVGGPVTVPSYLPTALLLIGACLLFTLSFALECVFSLLSRVAVAVDSERTLAGYAGSVWRVLAVVAVVGSTGAAATLGHYALAIVGALAVTLLSAVGAHVTARHAYNNACSSANKVTRAAAAESARRANALTALCVAYGLACLPTVAMLVTVRNNYKIPHREAVIEALPALAMCVHMLSVALTPTPPRASSNIIRSIGAAVTIAAVMLGCVRAYYLPMCGGALALACLATAHVAAGASDEEIAAAGKRD